MEFSAKEILCLIERASVIPDILRQKEEIEDLLVKFEDLEAYLKRFHSLDELLSHMRDLEDKVYMLKTYLTTEEAGKYLAISKYTLREAVKHRELPFYTPPGKGYYFQKDDLDAWMESFRVEGIRDDAKDTADDDGMDEGIDETDIQAQFEALRKRRGI
jgi:excisionase family DNA binding protein